MVNSVKDVSPYLLLVIRPSFFRMMLKYCWPDPNFKCPNSTGTPAFLLLIYSVCGTGYGSWIFVRLDCKWSSVAINHVFSAANQLKSTWMLFYVSVLLWRD